MSDEEVLYRNVYGVPRSVLREYEMQGYCAPNEGAPSDHVLVSDGTGDVLWGDTGVFTNSAIQFTQGPEPNSIYYDDLFGGHVFVNAQGVKTQLSGTSVNETPVDRIEPEVTGYIAYAEMFSALIHKVEPIYDSAQQPESFMSFEKGKYYVMSDVKSSEQEAKLNAITRRNKFKQDFFTKVELGQMRSF